MSARWREGAAWPLAGFALVHLFIFAVLFRTVYTVHVNGTTVFFGYASKVVAGQVPYRDFPLEYPPLALVFFTLPRLVASNFPDYNVAYHAQVTIWNLVVLATLTAMARRANGRPTIVLGAYTIFVLAVGPIILDQFDIFPAALTLFAMYAFQRGRPNAGWVALTLGTLTKLYPLLLVPVFALPALRRRDVAALRRSVLVCIATAVIALLPLLVVAPASIFRFLAYHSNRGIQIESTYAGLLLAADKWHLIHVGIGYGFGAWNVTGTIPDVVTPLSALLLLGAVGTSWLFIDRRMVARGGDSTRDVAFNAAACALVLCGALLTSKVLSPQYLIWLVPLLPLVTHERQLIWPVFTLIGVMTHYIFPANYDRFIFGNAGDVITVLILRNLLLIPLGLLLARSLGRTRVMDAA